MVENRDEQFQVDSMEKERRRVRRLLSLLWVVGVFCCFFPLFVFARCELILFSAREKGGRNVCVEPV